MIKLILAILIGIVAGSVQEQPITSQPVASPVVSQPQAPPTGQLQAPQATQPPQENGAPSETKKFFTSLAGDLVRVNLGLPPKPYNYGPPPPFGMPPPGAPGLFGMPPGPLPPFGMPPGPAPFGPLPPPPQPFGMMPPAVGQPPIGAPQPGLDPHQQQQATLMQPQQMQTQVQTHPNVPIQQVYAHNLAATNGVPPATTCNGGVTRFDPQQLQALADALTNVLVPKQVNPALMQPHQLETFNNNNLNSHMNQPVNYPPQRVTYDCVNDRLRHRRFPDYSMGLDF